MRPPGVGRRRIRGGLAIRGPACRGRRSIGLLKKGLDGTPSQTLATLLHERRGVKLRVLSERERSPVENACPRTVDRSGYRKQLSIARILAWADDHHAATGRWPTSRSGSIAGVTGDNWRTVADALCDGRARTAGRHDLDRRADRSTAAGSRTNLAPNLRVDQILRWADAYRQAHGCWPNEKCGKVNGVPGETWKGIAERLRKGGRGLSGGLLPVPPAGRAGVAPAIRRRFPISASVRSWPGPMRIIAPRGTGLTKGPAQYAMYPARSGKRSTKH